MSKTISVRLPDSISDELDDISLETERSKSFHITKAVEKYLEEFADLQIALDRLKDKDDELITSEEFRAEIGL
ncbi:MAG: DNA-binding protein [Candidatus Marinimicrobia bacterium]|nr:DNA-binding protein [Candidatus Neomarinimicrobiota bacterium]